MNIEDGNQDSSVNTNQDPLVKKAILLYFCYYLRFLKINLKFHSQVIEIPFRLSSYYFLFLVTNF